MNQPQYDEPMACDRRNPSFRKRSGSIWGWVAACAVLFLISCVIAALWNNEQQLVQQARSAPSIELGSCTAVPVDIKVYLDCGEKKYAYDKM